MNLTHECPLHSCVAEAKRQKPHLLEDPLAALISSSARHSAIVLMFLKDASLAPVLIR